MMIFQDIYADMLDDEEAQRNNVSIMGLSLMYMNKLLMKCYLLKVFDPGGW